jgi:hypothetical protein
MGIGAIIIVAIATTGVLLMRFRKRWVAAFNLAVTNRITSRFATRLPGLRHRDSRRSEVRQGLPNARECISSAGGIPHCADLRTRKRVGQECSSGWRMRA